MFFSRVFFEDAPRLFFVEIGLGNGEYIHPGPHGHEIPVVTPNGAVHEEKFPGGTKGLQSLQDAWNLGDDGVVDLGISKMKTGSCQEGFVYS